ncbi:MAG: serine/threonine protein kinase [Pyrinomonadaceae bacterium]|nr:serine/threonine protein kinase [Pyrinomonadaceae bacterium]
MNGLERFIGEVLDEKYRLEQLIGQGGMGAVFLATHLGTERPVALKIIAPQLMRNEELVARFKREARAAGRLRHPNVVDVTDFGFATSGRDRIAYLVMEYLDGCTLAEVLNEETRLPLEWVVDILEQVCSAVDDAHQQGIVHRDLKPDNIWLEPNRLGGYRVKVLDFGIAKLADTAADSISTEASTKHVLEPPTSSRTPPPAVIGNAAQVVATSPSPSTARRETPRPVTTEEAATLLQPATTDGAESETRIFDPDIGGAPAVDAEAATRLQASTSENADQTRPLIHSTARPLEKGITDTRSLSNLTRVGAIMGTPLYLSPEQCRGEHLDARSDIYSLGVIAYQMLTGATPFAGEMLEVMHQYREATPQPLRERNRKVPPRVARLVETALAKDPAERPQRASGFASALGAHAEGVGKLLQRAFALYSERFPIFFRIAVLAYLPVIGVTLLQLLFSFLNARDTMPKAVAITLSIILGLLTMIVNFLAPSIISGLTALLVTQWFLAPLRPVNLGGVLAVLRKKAWPFFTTGLLVSALFVVGCILLLLPGLIVLRRYALYAPIVLVEGLKNRAAMRRSRELTARAPRTVWAVVLIHLFLPMSVSALVGVLIALGKKAGLNVGAELAGIIPVLFNILLTPLLSITTALLYLKMRQAGGETLEGTSAQFEQQDAPRSKWQQRMRERLSISTTHNSRVDE